MPCLCSSRLSSRIIRDVINFLILLRNVNAIISENCESNNGTSILSYVPCDWRTGSIIPYTYNLYSMNTKRLINLVNNGLNYIEERSCLVFKEYNPIRLARRANLTYLFYSYSDVLESCCVPFFTKIHGRRLVLITPECMKPAEVAHVTLHGIGLLHERKQAFKKDDAVAVLFAKECPNVDEKKKLFNEI